MPSYEYKIDEKSAAGSHFISCVRDELQRALLEEKKSRKLTQQAIADKLHVNRSVINRQFMGLENLTARSIGELLWAIGWEPHFEAKKIVPEDGENEFQAPAKFDFPTVPPTLDPNLKPIKASGTGQTAELEITG